MSRPIVNSYVQCACGQQTFATVICSAREEALLEAHVFCAEHPSHAFVMCLLHEELGGQNCAWDEWVVQAAARKRSAGRLYCQRQINNVLECIERSTGTHSTCASMGCIAQDYGRLAVCSCCHLQTTPSSSSHLVWLDTVTIARPSGLSIRDAAASSL